MKRLLLAVPVCLLLTACQARYSTLRFRPIDTSSNLIMGDVQILVSRDHAQPYLAATSDEHGMMMVKNLRAGDQLIFTAPGFEKALVTLDLSAYVQRSPEASGPDVRFVLQDLDTVPVPLHRVGKIEKPEPLR